MTTKITRTEGLRMRKKRATELLQLITELPQSQRGQREAMMLQRKANRVMWPKSAAGRPAAL